MRLSRIRPRLSYVLMSTLTACSAGPLSALLSIRYARGRYIDICRKLNALRSPCTIEKLYCCRRRRAGNLIRKSFAGVGSRDVIET